MNKLTHTNNKGEAQMVDVSDKEISTRIAYASCQVIMQQETLQKIKENSLKKGDVLATSRIAGIMAAKKTAELIPMCHQLNLTKVSVEFTYIKNGILINTMAKLKAKTGVEMEALTAASIAGLTIYDMCKAVDKFIIITDLKMIKKSGGKSGDWEIVD